MYILMKMHLTLLLTLVLFLPVQSMWPSNYFDNNADSVYATVFDEDNILKNIGNKIMAKTAAKLFLNPGKLGFPERTNTTGVKDPEATEDEAFNGGVHCAHGNVFLSYRRPLSHELSDETITLNGNMFTTTAGQQGKMLSVYEKYLNYDISDTGFLEDIASAMQDIKDRTHRQTCWPSHGFHMHTSSDPDDPPFHLGPMCDSNEYFSVATHSCTACGPGLRPDFASMLSSTKYDNIQTLVVSECEAVHTYFERDIMKNMFPNATTIPCEELVNKLGWFTISGGDGTSTEEIPSSVIECIHLQCGSSVDDLYETVRTSIGWNFRDLHIGKYHPFAPLECRGTSNVPNGFESRGECSLCGFADDVCIKKDAQNLGTEAEPKYRCQREYAKTTWLGLHRVNQYDYTYTMPDFDRDKQYIIHDENIVFEGPDQSNIMTMSLEDLRHEYCFEMKSDGICKTLDDEPIQFEETPALLNASIYVSAGNLSEPFYEFYASADCVGDPLPVYDGMHHLATNTEYTFHRCENALTHPFMVEPSGEKSNYSGITNTSSLTLITGGEGRLYEWECTSHPSMQGKMVANDDVSRRRLYGDATVSAKKSKTRAGYTLDEAQKAKPDSYFKMSKTNLNMARIKPAPDIYKDEFDFSESSDVSSVLLNNSANGTEYVFDIQRAFSNGWAYGDLLGGTETFVDEYEDFSECYKVVLETYPDANGVTYDIDRERCYAEFNSGARNKNEVFISQKFPVKKEVEFATMHYPKDWVFSQMTDPRWISMSTMGESRRNGSKSVHSDMWQSGMNDTVDQKITFQKALFNKNDTNPTFGFMYDFLSRAELGTIVSWKWALELLDSAAATADPAVTLSARTVLTIGVNYEFNDTKKWSSLHVIELSGSVSKSKCLHGYMNKGIVEVHGIAVVPFTQDSPLIQADKNVENVTTSTETDSNGHPDQVFQGSINDYSNKDDFGIVMASVTKSDGSISMWVTTYDGVPFEVNEDTPGSRYVNFPMKWSKYAVDTDDAAKDYLRMAVVAEDQTVYIFDGEIDILESFQIIRGQGIISTPCGPMGSCKETALYKTAPEAGDGVTAIVESIRDIKWTADNQLLVATNKDVYLYKTKRSDRPITVCQNKKRQHEIDRLVPPGLHWELSDKCTIERKHCEAGTYQDEYGQQLCKQCEAGMFQPNKGQMACIECLPGQFQHFSGRTECEDCMPGFYSDRSGSPGLGPNEHDSIMLDYVCQSCPIGKFSMEKGASRCLKCKSDNHCDIRSQIFPHSECTPGSSDWVEQTDHIHEFCCSTSGYIEDNYDDETMRLTGWRSARQIHCIERHPIKVIRPPEFCGSLTDKISAALGRTPESSILNKVSDIDFDDVDNFPWDLIASAISSDVEYMLSFENNTNATLDAYSNYSVMVVENVTLEHEECLRNSANASIDYVLDIAGQDIEFPFGVMYNENSTETSTCFASLNVESIVTELNECCPNFADSSPELFKLDGTLDVVPGVDLHCISIYSTTDFDFTKYSSPNMTTTEYIDETPLGCYVTKDLGGENFHPLREEFFQCCPQAREDVIAENWQLWDFDTSEIASVSCYRGVDDEDECFLEYVYFNESGVTLKPTYEYMDPRYETCGEANLTYVETVVDVTTFEDCIDGWNLTGYEKQEIEFSDDQVCSEGWNETNGFVNYKAIYEGTCSDIWHEDVPWEGCYDDPQIWKYFIDSDMYGEVRFSTPTYEPKTCTVTTNVPHLHCEEYQFEAGTEEICTELNYELTNDEMNEQFEQQTCSDDFPCMCKQTTNCFRMNTECSFSNPCICSKYTTDCEWYPDHGDRECRCMRPTEVPEPSDYYFASEHNLTIEYKLEGFWTPVNYTYTNGVVQGMVISKEKTWHNLSASDIPIGISRSSDTWDGYYTEGYFYEVRSHDVEEVLIDMKGGIDYESTRGTDEFRYCRHEYLVEKTETVDNMFESYLNASNASVLRKVNGTEVKTKVTDAIYCSSFFPIARQAPDGSWTCSSVRECPYWEYWPGTINKYGFVETDPCICKGNNEYGGYCIPDLESLVPKVGEEFATLSQITGNSVSWEFVTTCDSPAETRAECVAAAAKIPGSFRGEVQWNTYPVGCFTSNNGVSVWWNTPSTGVPANGQLFACKTLTSLSLGLSNKGNKVAIAIPDRVQTFSSDGTQIGSDISVQNAAAVVLSSGGAQMALQTATKLQLYELTLNGSSLEGEIQGTFSTGASSTLLAISDDGLSVVAAFDDAVRVYEKKFSAWSQRGTDLSSSAHADHVDISADGSVIVFASGSFVRTYAWSENDWQVRGGSISGDRVSLSGDGGRIAVSIPSTNTVKTYSWRSTRWVQTGSDTSSDTSNGMIMSSDKTIMATCGLSNIELYQFNIGEWRLIRSETISAYICALSPDGSVLAYSAGGNVQVIATSLEQDNFLLSETWVSDVDEYFKNASYHKYNRPCGVGSVKKALSEYDMTNISWWEDAYERACMCEAELCSGYEAHRILVGLSENLPSSQLLTMTCASDGCIYDQINADRWQVKEDEFEDCTYARNETCGVYSFGRYNDQMLYEPLRGFYDEDGGIKSGAFKCPYTNGNRRNDFVFDALNSSSIYVRDGDFDITPNGMPAYCACKRETCHYDQYCSIELERGFCGNTKGEIHTKVLEASILPECTLLPDEIISERLDRYISQDTCTCNDKFCDAGSYCSANGCVECVCSDNQYEELYASTFSTCRNLTPCDVGEYVSNVQTRYSDRECSLCEEGVNYSPYVNTHTCVPCTKCLGQTITECTLSTDTECGLPCLPDEEEFDGACVKRCVSKEHRDITGTCVLCEHGAYFNGQTCQDCPDGHYTNRRGRSSVNRPVKSICYPHDLCNSVTHFWAEPATRSSAGRCQMRYTGNCAIRVVGGANTDDTCQNFRDVDVDHLASIHAIEMNYTGEINADAYNFQHRETMRIMVEILETHNYYERPKIGVLRIVSRYMYANKYNDITEPYIDVTFGEEKMRIYTLLDSVSVGLWNLQTPVQIDPPAEKNISSIFFTKNETINVNEGPWECSNVRGYMFLCLPRDVEPPVITLNGDAAVFVTAGYGYQDAGATATDNTHGNVTLWIKTNSTVDTSTAGEYRVIYSVYDRAGNEASKERIVRIV